MAPGESTGEERSETTTIHRRHVLRASAAATVGGIGLTSAPGTSAAAELFGACESGYQEAPADYPIVDLTESDPSTRGDFPTGAEEFVIYVHGWLEEFAQGGRNQGYTLEDALEQNDYDHPTVAAIWDSNEPVWELAKAQADEAGQRLATWLDGYLEEYPDTTIRTVDHSLGSRVVLESLNALDGDEVLENVSLIGAAVNPETVCEDGTYEQGITNSAEAVYNYHSENDDIVCNMYQFAEFDEGLGCNGSNCDTGSSGPAPSNYTDVDVSDQVDNHCDYGKPDVGCVPQIVDNF